MSDASFKALISVTDGAGTDEARQVWTGKSKHRQTELILNYIKQTKGAFSLSH